MICVNYITFVDLFASACARIMGILLLWKREVTGGDGFDIRGSEPTTCRIQRPLGERGESNGGGTDSPAMALL